MKVKTVGSHGRSLLSGPWSSVKTGGPVDSRDQKKLSRWCVCVWTCVTLRWIYLDVPLEVRINGWDQWVISPTYKWCVPRGYNPLTHHLLASCDIQVGGGFEYVLFSPRTWGKMIQFDLRIFFQMLLVQPPTTVAWILNSQTPKINIKSCTCLVIDMFF